MGRRLPLLFTVVIALVAAVLGLAGCDASAGVAGDGGGGGGEALGSISPTGTPRLVVGDPVAANWIDGYLYLATIEGIEGNAVTVRYADDLSTRTVEVTEVRAIPAREWKPGDRVLASWSTGRFLEGAIKSKISTVTYEVKWQDGAAPSDVNYRRIITREP